MLYFLKSAVFIMEPCRRKGCNCNGYDAMVATVYGSESDVKFWYPNFIPPCRCGHAKNMHGVYIDPITAAWNAFITGTKYTDTGTKD